ncbi:hypothetical protein Tco_0448067 [Tanacetum coccineum]
MINSRTCYLNYNKVPKSVLVATPIYNMSLFKVPKSVLNKMESLRKNFFNGIQDGERKIAWVKWQSVLAAKKHGGLGVSSFFALNRGLLAKIRIGNGVHTCFWKDFWIGDTRLQGMFPRLYALESYKRQFFVVIKSGAPFYYTSSRRDVREDRWTCDLNGEGVFRVKDVRNLLDEHFLPNAGVPTRWIKYVPIKVNIFAWKVFLD